jgi:predicted nuclease of predicted toxin-antitoxin system
MKLLADECCAAPLVKLLRDEGHNVLYVMENMRGTTDAEILNLAHKEQRIPANRR